MRARLPFVAGLAGVILIVALIGSSSSSSSYRVDAVFDTAKGMVPGQLVEIAGARVGTISAVKVLHEHQTGYEAVIEMHVQRQFAPFHAGARCQILPQGPISENYVECSPGPPASGPLATGPFGAPTVPITHNTEALDVQDVLNVFSMPTDQRLGIVLDELGIATAGRGADINTIIRRANPALTQADHVLTELGSQRTELGNAVTQTDTIVGEVASASSGLRDFVDRAASVARTTAAHAPAVGRGVAGLPVMLTKLDAGLRSVDTVTRTGTPLLRALQTSAPGLLTLTHTLTSFSAAGTPALRALGPAAHEGVTAIPAAAPLVDQLHTLARSEGTTASMLDHLLTSARDRGFIDGLLLTFYGITANDAGYDGISHFLSAVVQVYPGCIADNTMLGCQHSFNSAGHGILPVNNPSAGPQNDWAPVPGGTEKLAADAGAGAGSSSGAPSNATASIVPARTRALLEYLLK
jgi:ABC-type transporter Mla subunit MlaD